MLKKIEIYNPKTKKWRKIKYQIINDINNKVINYIVFGKIPKKKEQIKVFY